MDNQQFRRLVLDAPRQQDGTGSPPPSTPSGSISLGSRKRSSIPMTPHNVRGNMNAEFARQLAERNAKANPAKHFKSSAPKGSKLAAGYTDRTQNRNDEDTDEKAQRIKALEESMKLGQIDRETFETLVEEITGGDIGATHLVKGLDRRLLERVRRGEVGISGESNKNEPVEDVEDEFEKLAEQEVAPVVREKVERKGKMAPTPLVAGAKRTRDAILAELKAQRKAAAEAAAAEHKKRYPGLGKGFRRIGENMETSRIEIDAKGREVLITTDADGKEKRKIRKQKVEEPPAPTENIHILDDGKTKIPQLPALAAEDEEDEDIFEGVGSNYNPLAGLDAEDDSSSDEEESEAQTSKKGRVESGEEDEEVLFPAKKLEEGVELDSRSPSKSPSLPPDTFKKPSQPFLRRSYFKDNPSTSETLAAPSADATVLAALKKVRTIDPESSLLQTIEEARLRKRAAMLAAADRDMDDLDMGFGGSRFDDAEEMEREGEKVKLSEWKGAGVDEDEGHEGRSDKKRKRGPKKKKGDKNSAADVLKVMEKQKESKTLG
ncbi:hypothetical protein K469DRAFT_722475 [Zopfia rhizophila CBS 207.26]|uniref:RED-like N-terminal domain-containing protein n=1 Tax=Zopfia rhizophila CBS 207.26 TaxID=1314779 RepID=A0A6A6EVG6_9PEZI|nr:hypothetical protein K469DRAFT_722475 [Zopfia rhizophila CBS 207.26]